MRLHWSDAPTRRASRSWSRCPGSCRTAASWASCSSGEIHALLSAMRSLEQEKIAVIGLGYVGLPVAISFGRKLSTVGFDIRQRRVDDLKRGHDDTLEVTDA